MNEGTKWEALKINRNLQKQLEVCIPIQDLFLKKLGLNFFLP